ncbi:MAG: ATP-dependent RNA helicase [Polyangiaceae bacterium]|nr:ATP-dependent RNA helicase [Polyangiaceae bacterium]MCW5790721.1 ATP-dependent RNA helicase [Polyangiaceae bacterium]
MQALPIDDCLPELVARLGEARAVLVEAPPGAGKSTRVPLAVAGGSWGDAARAGSSPSERVSAARQVWVSEPRRLAARLLAHRVAAELGEPVGERVGYAVRFERRVSARTEIVYVTTGVLLQELLSTPGAALPSHIKAVIVDEVHERSVETDLLLALLRREMERSPHFKLVVMSATLDAAPIAAFLGEGLRGGCPNVRSAGQSYPVRISHEEAPDDRALERRVASAVRRQLSQGPTGDVLVFLPGAREIRAAASALAPLAEQGIRVLSLHGELPLSEQSQVLSPGPERRVILSTNVAESSVTVPRTTSVVDSGLARVARHSPWSGVTSLQVEPISQASATQRAGRAGRTAAGEVVRLYSALDLSQRPGHLAPEILRADLAELVLQLGRGGLTPSELCWLSPPTPSALSDAYALLTRLGATDSSGKLTHIGHRMAKLPLSPRAARVTIAACELGVGETGALAATLLTERDPRERGELERQRARGARGDSDLEERIECFREAQDRGLDRRACRAVGLSHEAAQRIARGAEQLRRLLKVRHDDCQPSEVSARLSQALLTGYADRVAGRRSGRALVLCTGQAARLAEESVVHDAPLLIVLEASQRAARGVEVSLACAISEEQLFEQCADEFRDQDTLTFNPETERVELTARLYYGSICLDERRAAAPPSEAATRALTAWVLERGLASLDPDDRLGELAARVSLLAELDGPSAEAQRNDDEHRSAPNRGGPQREGAVRGADAKLSQRDASHADVLRSSEADHQPITREALLTAALEGAIDLRGVDARALEGRALVSLPPPLTARLERELPRELKLASGRRLTIRYAAGKEPWVESRLQDFFGCVDTPRIASGRLPLTLHLLAPNRRAVQITRDLAGFWQRGYPELRRQLSRRYPKHAWPEDGKTATPPAPRPPAPKR